MRGPPTPMANGPVWPAGGGAALAAGRHRWLARVRRVVARCRRRAQPEPHAACTTLSPGVPHELRVLRPAPSKTTPGPEPGCRRCPAARIVSADGRSAPVEPAASTLVTGESVRTGRRVVTRASLVGGSGGSSVHHTLRRTGAG